MCVSVESFKKDVDSGKVHSEYRLRRSERIYEKTRRRFRLFPSFLSNVVERIRTHFDALYAAVHAEEGVERGPGHVGRETADVHLRVIN